MKQSLAIIYNNLRQHTGGRSLWQLNLILNTVNPFHSSRILVLFLEEALLNFSLSNTCTKSTGLERRLFTVLFLLEFFVSTWPAILYKVKKNFFSRNHCQNWIFVLMIKIALLCFLRSPQTPLYSQIFFSWLFADKHCIFWCFHKSDLIKGRCKKRRKKIVLVLPLHTLLKK